MAMMDGNGVFLDTNVLIHATVAQSPLFQKAQETIAQYKRNNIDLWISRQVLREYLAGLSRPQSLLSLNQPIPASTLVAEVKHLIKQYHLAEESHRVTEELLGLMISYPIGGRQVHDANIVATMAAYGIRSLLTENISDFNRFSAIIEIIPLN
jgi:predicted nucleic acid-binding protein